MTTSLPILYSFRRCPFAMRARLALQAADLRVELREVVLRDKPQALRDASPKATVPVLVLPGGEVIDESLDIMLWALGRSDPLGLLGPVGGEQAAQARALVAVNDGPFKQLLDRYKYASRHPEHPAEHYRDEAVALWLAPLDERIARQGWLLDAGLSIADLAVMPFVRQFAQVDPAWFERSPFAPLRAWLERLCTSAHYGAVMRRFEPWRPGDSPVIV